MRLKKYYVVAILSDTELIINAGRKDNITIKDSFDILDNQTKELIDPISKKTLDSFVMKKQRVYVTEVKEEYCICVSEYIEKSSYHPIIDSTIQKKVGRKMNVDKKEVTDIMSEFNYSTIHPKDPAKLASRH